MSLNLCQFIGRLGADPETRYLQDGTAVVNINIACSERWKDRQTGEQKEKTEWIRASAFGKQAEIISQYFKKGSQIYISGQMQTRKYQDQNGQDRYSTAIRIREFQFLDKKDDNQQTNNSQQSSNPQQNNQGQQQNNQQQYNQNQARKPQNNNPNPPTTNYADFDDDIPF